MGNGCIDPHFLDLGTSWRWVVNFTPRPLYPRGKVGGWVDLRAGLDDLEKRKFFTLPGFEVWPLGRPARSQSLYRLRYPGSNMQVSHQNASLTTMAEAQVAILKPVENIPPSSDQCVLTVSDVHWDLCPRSTVCTGVKRPESKYEHLLSSNAEKLSFMAWCVIKQRHKFNFPIILVGCLSMLRQLQKLSMSMI
jgi:hypothetical protein